MAKNYGIKGMTEEELRAHRQKQFNQMMLKKNRANTATVSNEQLRRQMQLAQGMKSNEELNPSLFNQYWPKDNTKTGRTPFMTGLQNFAKDSIFQDKNNAKAINASLANQTAEQGAQKAGFDNYNLFAEDALQQIYDIDNPVVQAAKLAEVRQGLGRDVTGLGPTPTQPRTYPSDNIFNNRMGSDAKAPDQFKAQQMAGLLADQNRMQQGQIGNTGVVPTTAGVVPATAGVAVQEENSPSFFGNFFDKDNYTGMYDNVTGAVKDVMPLAKELLDFSTAGQDPEANQTTMAQIQAGIDADAGRTTQENYELASGVDRAPAQMTAASISESIAETFELAETAVDAEASGTTIDLEFVVGKEKADMLSEWAKGSVISDTAKSWGSLIMDKFGFAGDDQELTEVEIDNIIAVKNELVPNAGQDGLLVGETTSSDYVEQPATSDVNGLLNNGNTSGATHTMPDGTIMPGATHPTSTATSGATSSYTTPSLMTTTTDSTAGFTMDRFKNPLSAENKAWWLGGGGGVPGNNRAKEFFDTLAYIGTPMKYRPAKTPSQQGMENRIANNNNIMDYASSMASSSSTANQNTFTKLKAAVPSQTSIASGIAGEFFDQAGMFEGKAETERRIDRRAAEIREKMLAMAAQGIYPTKEKVYAAEAKEAERLAEIKRLQEEEQARNQPEETKSSSWFSELLN